MSGLRNLAQTLVLSYLEECIASGDVSWFDSETGQTITAAAFPSKRNAVAELRSLALLKHNQPHNTTAKWLRQLRDQILKETLTDD